VKTAAIPAPNLDGEENIPAPKTTSKSKATPESQATPTPAAQKKARGEKVQKPSPTPVQTPKLKAKAEKPTPNMRGSIPFVPENSPKAEPEQKAESLPPLEQDAKEKVRMREIKATALEDADIKALKDKADAASDSDQKAASKAYYKALYEKMRSIDPMLKERIDRTESIMMKRIDGGAAE
jgi:hypothetical protein